MNVVAENLTVGYGIDKPVFEHISFTTEPGDLVALLGMNGIGKSTLLRTIAGLQKPLEGQIWIGEKKLSDLPVTDKARLVSMVLTEKIAIENMSVRELIALGRSPYTSWLGNLAAADLQIVNEIIELLHLKKMGTKYFDELSDGEKQKVLIARALCQQTPVIILDEPTAFLDYRNKKEIMDILRQICGQLNKTIILSTHDIEAALKYSLKCWIMTDERKFVEIKQSSRYRADVETALNIDLM